MANILSLAMKINADASGVVKNLTPAERALEKLGVEATKVTKVFDEFAGTSGAAATAQASAAQSLADLTASLERGDINAKQFADSYAQLTEEINKEAAAFRRAAQITDANLLSLERYNRTAGELEEQLRAGRITQETFNRAMEKARTDLDRAGNAAKSTDKSMESLARNTSILAGIEIGRLFVDGLQALGNVFRDIAGRVSSLVTTVNGSIDTLNDFSARTGIGVEALQGYSLAAKLAGVDTEQFLAAVQKLAVNIGKATPGDALDKAFKGINLSLQELRALSPEDQFSAIGTAISELPTASDRAAAAVAVFGKQGAALAPLFREGITSIKELRAEGTRLGAIVSDVQVGNVAKMNDAFDKVRATVQGIVGQVIGNLAPAVTDVTNQFLEFVKTFEGTGSQGTGGNGIANAITDVLLKGADYFAGIFDLFVENFGDLGEVFTFAADIFDVTSKVLMGVSESFRVVFNLLQLGIDALIVGFGKVLEGLGSFVSSDLEEYGRGLVDAGMESTERNSREMEAAAANAAETFNSIFTGGSGNPQAAGQGAGKKFIAGLRAEVENARLPEVKVQTDLGTAQERLDAYFKTAEDGGSAFFRQSAETVTKFREMAAAGGLTADQITIMNGFMDDLNLRLNKEIADREAAADAATAQADADKKRLDQLLQTNDAAAKIEQDLQVVQREQVRVSKELAAARKDDDAAAANAAAARKAELDQLQTKLQEQQQALRQGFSGGFDEAFASVDQSIGQLIEKSSEFGAAGQAAADQLKAGIADARAEAKDGFYTKEQYDQEVRRVTDLYEKQLESMRDLAEQRQRVNEFVDEQLALQSFGGDAQRLEASRRVLEIEQEIVRVQQELSLARDSGDKTAANAAAQRLAALDQVAARERDIASGRVKIEEELLKQRAEAEKAYLEQQKKAQEEYAREQQRIFEEQRKAAEAEAKRQEERLAKLNTLGEQTVNAQDIRSSEGAALVLNLAAAAQDPALIQQRLQTKLLEQIATGITQAAANYFNSPVGIVGGSLALDPRAQQNVRL